MLYSALQASRLGLRALIVTRGVPAEIEALLEPFRPELAVRIEPSEHTTTLQTNGVGAARHQQMLAWAGPISDPGHLEGTILHLAPVAAELPTTLAHQSALVGLTPQGLVRRWSTQHPQIVSGPASAASVELARSCHAIVLSEQEREGCEQLVEAAVEAGAIVAVTAGPGATTIMGAADMPLTVAVNALPGPVEDLGAGDVYACAFFIALNDGQTPAQAAQFAGAAAAERMLGSGPAAIAGRAAIEARLAHRLEAG